MEDFVLQDSLCHKAYSFPQTLLTFRHTGVSPEVGRDVLLRDGVPVAYDVEKNADGYRLQVVSDLKYAGKYAFTWDKGDDGFACMRNGNGLIEVESVKNGLYRVKRTDGGQSFLYALMTAALPQSVREKKTVGRAQSVFTKTFVFSETQTYTFTLKLTRDLDYVEVYEQMRGFEENECKLAIAFENFTPDMRYTKERGEEKIDAYLRADGAFPFLIDPFMPRTSYWDCRSLAYADGKSGFWSGILLHDLKHFDDGQYAVWGSGASLAMIPYADKVVCPVVDGKRAFMHVLSKDRNVAALGSHYLRYYSIASLDRFKDWVLDWPDDKTSYPKYFKVNADTAWGGFYGDRVGKPSPARMMEILDRSATDFASIEEIAPVSCRAYRTSWAQTFDLSASELTDEQFKRVRAAMAFVCYVFTDENYYPVETVLGGHPNFLTDVIGTVAVFAALLGKAHPMHDSWLKYYEIALARNFKYHIRPAVKAWNAEGGRWTENIGAYMMTMLRCVVYDCHVVYKLSGEIPFLYPHVKPFIDFLLNMRTPENEQGRRLYMPHGAHACTGAYGGKFGHGFALYMLMLADMLKHYDPLAAESIAYNFRKDVAAVKEAADIYGVTVAPDTAAVSGVPPALSSAKYTGLGFMLRHSVGADDESCVFLQQIDEGPNYRWGRAAQGGCGEIYYYADRKQYTDHAPEDVGDENRGDVQACTNFGVLIGHEYRSVGRNDLTEPLIDLGFVQYARVNAGDYSAPYYKYRSVLAVENRYIAVYDAVADKFQAGRFAWAQHPDRAFPVIRNVRPNVQGRVIDGGYPVDKDGGYAPKYFATKVMAFDGKGDFLTVVSHLKNEFDERMLYSIDPKPYGADVVFPQTTDRVFCDAAHISVQEADFAFEGRVGYATTVGDEIRLAVIDGRRVRLGELTLEAPYDDTVRRGIGAIEDRFGVHGTAVFAADGMVAIGTPREGDVYVDGVRTMYAHIDGEYSFVIPAGRHTYTIGCAPDPARPRVSYAEVGTGRFTLVWERAIGALTYEIAASTDGGFTYRALGKVDGAQCRFTAENLQDGKYCVRVRAIGLQKTGEWSAVYPVYVSGDVPPAPQGLRVEKRGDRYRVSWGEVLGCSEYRLYEKGKKDPVYTGKAREYDARGGVYRVTAVNGNGESKPSNERDSDDIRACWDNHPQKGFVRDTRSFEHGYGGFDYIGNREKPILRYPNNQSE